MADPPSARAEHDRRANHRRDLRQRGRYRRAGPRRLETGYFARIRSIASAPRTEGVTSSSLADKHERRRSPALCRSRRATASDQTPASEHLRHSRQHSPEWCSHHSAEGSRHVPSADKANAGAFDVALLRARMWSMREPPHRTRCFGSLMPSFVTSGTQQMYVVAGRGRRLRTFLIPTARTAGFDSTCRTLSRFRWRRSFQTRRLTLRESSKLRCLDARTTIIPLSARPTGKSSCGVPRASGDVAGRIRGADVAATGRAGPRPDPVTTLSGAERSRPCERSHEAVGCGMDRRLSASSTSVTTS